MCTGWLFICTQVQVQRGIVAGTLIDMADFLHCVHRGEALGGRIFSLLFSCYRARLPPGATSPNHALRVGSLVAIACSVRPLPAMVSNSKNLQRFPKIFSPVTTLINIFSPVGDENVSDDITTLIFNDHQRL